MTKDRRRSSWMPWRDSMTKSYYFKHPIVYLKDIKLSIKYSYQRITRGYSGYDIINMDHYLRDIIIMMLKEFRKCHPGVPDDLTPEEYDKILKKMIKEFERSDKDTTDFVSKYPYKDSMSKEYTKKWLDEEAAKQKYMDDAKDRAFKLLSKYFNTLWT